jgi:hypothetical protein
MLRDDANPLLRLLAGEMSDAEGNTVPAEDRWIRTYPTDTFYDSTSETGDLDWEDLGDPNVLYAPGVLIKDSMDRWTPGTPSNVTGLAVKIKFNGSCHPSYDDTSDAYGRLICFTISYINRQPDHPRQGQWMDWADIAPSSSSNNLRQGHLLFAYPAAPTTNAPIVVELFLSVTKDRIIITAKGTPDPEIPNYTGHTSTIYIGVFKPFAPSNVDYHPVIMIGTHGPPFGEHWGRSSFLCLGGQNNNPHPDSVGQGFHYKTSGSNPIGTSTQYTDVDVFSLGSDTRDWDVYPGRWSGPASVTNTEPNAWSERWYFYPIYIMSSEWYRISGIYASPAKYTGPNTYTDGTVIIRGKLIDLYSLQVARQDITPNWENLSVLNDGVYDYRLASHTEWILTPDGSYAQASFGGSSHFRSPKLAWRQL